MSTVEKLAVGLRSKDGTRREQSRKELVKIGRQSVPTLHKILSDPDQLVRWEACKALGSIMDSSSIEPLVDTLRDDSIEVRWLAAEALIAFGRAAVVPLLQALEVHFESTFFREGAHHILHALEGEKKLEGPTLSVLDKLGALEPKSSVALAAYEALNTLRKAQLT